MWIQDLGYYNVDSGYAFVKIIKPPLIIYISDFSLGVRLLLYRSGVFEARFMDIPIPDDKLSLISGIQLFINSTCVGFAIHAILYHSDKLQLEHHSNFITWERWNEICGKNL